MPNFGTIHADFQGREGRGFTPIYAFEIFKSIMLFTKFWPPKKKRYPYKLTGKK